MKDYTRADVISNAVFDGGEYNRVFADIKNDVLIVEDSAGNERRMQYSKIKIKRDSHWNVSAWYEGSKLGSVWWEKGKRYEA